MHGITSIIFVATYALLAVGRARPFRLDRTGIAIVVAAALIATGALTLALGSVANLIVIEQARRQGIEITFGTYLRIGAPITLLTLAAAVGVFSL